MSFIVQNNNKIAKKKLTAIFVSHTVEHPAKGTPSFAGKKKPFTFPKPSISMLSGKDEPMDDRIFVDTCAAFELLILIDNKDFSKLRKIDKDIGCAALGTSLTVEAVGSIGPEEEIYYCPN
jgi:hypothetical protein